MKSLKYFRKRYSKNKYYEKSNGIITKYSAEEFIDKLLNTDGICEVCKGLFLLEALEVDHIITIKEMREHKLTECKIDNIRFICHHCNIERHLGKVNKFRGR